MDNLPYETEAEVRQALAAREKRMREIAEEWEKIDEVEFERIENNERAGLPWEHHTAERLEKQKALRAKLLEGLGAE